MSVKLSWFHYIELLSVQDNKARGFYQSECENYSWSARELRRKISSPLYEILSFSIGEVNKDRVLELSKARITYNSSNDFVKDKFNICHN